MNRAVETWKKTVIGRKVKAKKENIAAFCEELQKEYTLSTKNVVGKVGKVVDAKFYPLEGLQELTVKYEDGTIVVSNQHIFDFVA